MGDRAAKPVVLESREDAVNVHQLRAGHWSSSVSYTTSDRLSPGEHLFAGTRARWHDAGCVARVPMHRSMCCWSAPVWRALVFASMETLNRTRGSCETVGPWRPWVAATYTTQWRRKAFSSVCGGNQLARAPESVGPLLGAEGPLFFWLSGFHHR